MKTYLFLLSALLLTCLIAPALAILETSGAWCSGTITYTYYAAPVASGGDNANSGLDTANPKTLAGCITIAKNNKEAGTPYGTKIILMNGTYRYSTANDRINLTLNDSVNWKTNPLHPSTPIVIEAQNTGQAIISGAEEFNSWTEDPGGSGKWRATWANNWGTSWPGWPEPDNDIVKRREIVAVNDVLLTPNLSNVNTDGTFYVDEAADRIWVNPTGSTNPNTADTEVATQGHLMEMMFCNNLTIRGLTFKFDSHQAGSGEAARIINCNNVFVDDCTVRYGSYYGFRTDHVKNVTLRRLVASDNGGLGLSQYRCYDVLTRDCNTSNNNWRGDLSGFNGWDTSGVKDFICHRITHRGLISCNNKAGGYWMDIDGTDIVLDHCFIDGNETQGVFFEASAGPYLIKNSVISHNGDGGIRSGHAENVTIEKSVIYGNTTEQFRIEEANADREVNHMNESDFSNGSLYYTHCQDWTLTDNIIVCDDGSELMTGTNLNSTYYNYWSNSLTADDNTWWRASGGNPFTIYNGGGSKVTTDFTGWKADIGGGTQEGSSQWADPRFTDAANDVFQPNPWANDDFGTIKKYGYSFFSPVNKVFSVGGAGANIGAASNDEMQFAYQQFKLHDGEFVARVTAFDNTNADAKVGIMFRKSLTDTSENVALVITPSNGWKFQYRDTVSGSTTTTTGSYTYPNVLWLKLTYNGSNTITAYKSTDGSSWGASIGTATVSLGSTPYVGLVVCSRVETTVCNATFDNITTAGNIYTTSGSGGADVHVRGNEYCDNNYGTNQYLTVQNGYAGQSSSNILGYARFDLSLVPGPHDKVTYAKVTYRLAVANGANAYNYTVWGLNDGFVGGGATGLTYRSAAVTKIDEDDWPESGGGSLTWRNAPGNTINAYAVNTDSSYGNGNVGWAYNSTSLGSFSIAASAAVLTQGYSAASAVRDFVKQDVNGKVTFILTRNEVNINEATQFVAKDHATYGASYCPILYVKYAP